MSAKRVGIYAGTFDPIHAGHIAFAEEAIKNANLDKVFILVEPRPRWKQGVKSLEHRLAMVERAIADEPAIGMIVLDQARFTVHDTWPKIQARFAGAELAMLMGEDVFMHLSHWPRIDELVRSVEFVVGLRSHDEQAVRDHMTTIERTKGIALRYQVFASTQSRYSSTKIRSALRAGRQPEGVHPDVLKYIAGHKLYASSEPKA